MVELAEVLERFNRKERNLLVREALGHRKTPLRLSAEFRRIVEKSINERQHSSGAGNIKKIPEDAWWATDYH